MRAFDALTDAELDELSIEMQNQKDALLENLRGITAERDLRARRRQAELKLSRMSTDERAALEQALGVPGVQAGAVGSIG